MNPDPTQKVKPEDQRPSLSDKELETVAKVYSNYYIWNSRRSGSIVHFQGNSLEDTLTLSRELFWNSVTTKSDDLSNLGLEFSLPFARKEVMDFLGRLTALQIKPRIVGDEMDSIGIKVLQGMYKKWSFKSNERVENFWELLYGIVNGTVCSYIGYNSTKRQRRYLQSYDPSTDVYSIKSKEQKYWNDVWKEIVPLEDIYLPKIYERNIQKQGKLIWKTQMDEDEFHANFDSKYKNAKYVVPGDRIASDSLYYRLLGGSGTTSFNKIELLRQYDWEQDEFVMTASGILLNGMGADSKIEVAPMPFNHKMAPFTWGIMGPLDEKLAYGLPMPFLIKDSHKILNTAYTMMVERELRAIDPVILSSDIETQDFIYGQHKVVQVNDVEAYKEFRIQEPSTDYFNMMNSLQSNMSSTAQGGDSQIVPSRQPKSAREVSDISALRQQAMANATTMYYDIIRQRVLLVLKTALQFYSLDKYEEGDERVFRKLVVENMPLSLGGQGDMEIRFVKEKKGDLDLFVEALRKAAMNGKQLEIIEVPLSFITDLEFEITEVELDQEKSTELELQSFIENVINPMINVYVPAGVADIDKVFLRHLEKMGEAASDFATADVLAMLQNPGKAARQMPAMGSNPQNGVDQNPAGAFGGNMMQSLTGMKFGGQNNKGLPIPR